MNIGLRSIYETVYSLLSLWVVSPTVPASRQTLMNTALSVASGKTVIGDNGLVLPVLGLTAIPMDGMQMSTSEVSSYPFLSRQIVAESIIKGAPSFEMRYLFPQEVEDLNPLRYMGLNIFSPSFNVKPVVNAAMRYTYMAMIVSFLERQQMNGNFFAVLTPTRIFIPAIITEIKTFIVQGNTARLPSGLQIQFYCPLIAADTGTKANSELPKIMRDYF